MNELTIRQPDDFHAHLRQGEMSNSVIPLTSHFGRALVMPNTTPPILTAQDAKLYRDEIVAAGATFEPLMTIKITSSTTPDIIRDAASSGLVAGKLYPEGVTTNSQDGVRDLRTLEPVFAAMADYGMVLCVHAETPGEFVLDREARFIESSLPWIVETFSNLRVVVEHLSTAAAVDFVRRGGDHVAGTITVHHLLLTLDDVIGDMLEPHHFCKPVAKRPADRAALIEAATSGNGSFFLGTDSAPHPQVKKECASGCAGVFTAPVAVCLLAELFEENGSLDNLDAFASSNGAHFYRLPLNEQALHLTRQAWQVPASYGDIVPLCAGKVINWGVKE